MPALQVRHPAGIDGQMLPDVAQSVHCEAIQTLLPLIISNEFLAGLPC